MVQKIVFRCEIDKTCMQCPKSGPKVAEFYEAWPVRKGRKRVVLGNPLDYDAYTDTGNVKIVDGICAFSIATGEIRFYCEFDKNNIKASAIGLDVLWDKNKTYGKGDCTISTGKRPSTKDTELFWGEKPIEGPAYRYLYVRYDCCKCHKNYVDAYGFPQLL